MCDCHEHKYYVELNDSIFCLVILALAIEHRIFLKYNKGKYGDQISNLEVDSNKYYVSIELKLVLRLNIYKRLECMKNL